MVNSIKEILSVFIFFIIALTAVIFAVVFWILAFPPRVILTWIFSDRTFREAINKVLVDSGLKNEIEEVI